MNGVYADINAERALAGVEQVRTVVHKMLRAMRENEDRTIDRLEAQYLIDELHRTPEEQEEEDAAMIAIATEEKPAKPRKPQRPFEVLYKHACDSAFQELETMVRKILRENSDIHEFCTSMGCWGFYDLSNNRIEDSRVQGVEGFMEDWDDVFKLSYKAVHITANGSSRWE